MSVFCDRYCRTLQSPVIYTVCSCPSIEYVMPWMCFWLPIQFCLAYILCFSQNEQRFGFVDVEKCWNFEKYAIWYSELHFFHYANYSSGDKTWPWHVLVKMFISLGLVDRTFAVKLFALFLAVSQILCEQGGHPLPFNTGMQLFPNSDVLTPSLESSRGRGFWGITKLPQQGLWQSPSWSRIWWILTFKIWHLMATNIIIFRIINWPHLVQFQHYEQTRLAWQHNF